jgi:regulator of sigma E protease
VAFAAHGLLWFAALREIERHMAFFAAVFDTFGWILGTIIPFIIVLGIVIFVHELGHYMIGRWCGLKTTVFSIGCGPEIVGWDDRHGTRWRLAWIPLGGYVKFKGDADAASLAADQDSLDQMSQDERRQTIAGAPLWARALTIIGGPGANFLLSILLAFLIILINGRSSEAPVIGVVDPGGQAQYAGFREGDRIIDVDGAPIESFGAFVNAILSSPGTTHKVSLERKGDVLELDAAFTRATRISDVRPNTAAQAACMAPGDEIISVNGTEISSFEQLQSAVLTSEGDPLDIVVARRNKDGFTEDVALTLKPTLQEKRNQQTGEYERVYMIGVVAESNLGFGPATERPGVIAAFHEGLHFPLRVIGETFGYLGAWISGQVAGENLAGPIGIARASGMVAEQGIVTFIGYIATISTAIGLINLFPIPILDGGHLVLYGIEAIRGRPLSVAAVNFVSYMGLIAILSLLVFATINDLTITTSSVWVDC